MEDLHQEAASLPSLPFASNACRLVDATEDIALSLMRIVQIMEAREKREAAAFEHQQQRQQQQH
jgi:hypothetical protein